MEINTDPAVWRAANMDTPLAALCLKSSNTKAAYPFGRLSIPALTRKQVLQKERNAKRQNN